MATQTTAGSSDFIKNLGRMYGTYTGSFVAFIILLAILEQVGVPNRILGYLFVGFTIAVYAVIGIMTRTAQISEYYVAGRRVPAFYNGMATGADWMSAASFVGMAGTLFLLGYDGLTWVLGWTGGYVLVSILIGPVSAQVRRLHRARLHVVPVRRQLRPLHRGDRAGVLLLHLRDGAGLRHRPHRLALPRHAVRVGGVRRPRRHPALLDAGRHAGGDLDADRPVHRADHRLPDADRDPVDQALRDSDPGTDLRAGDRRNHRARAGNAGDRTGHCGGAQAAHPAVHQLQPAELLRHHVLHDGGHGVAAAHPDALLHHADGA